MHTPVPTALKVHTMDSGIGNITAALRQRQMWSTTLIVMSSDNGGREDKEFGGNNWYQLPLSVCLPVCHSRCQAAWLAGWLAAQLA